jgi:UDP-N-acetylmuramate dehydrogenase
MTLALHAWLSERREQFTGPLLFDELLSKHTYYRIGGAALCLAMPKSLDDLEILRKGIQETGVPYFILGKGSNLLVADTGFAGLVICTGKMNLEITPVSSQISNPAETCVRTGASVMVSSLLRRATQEGWGGLEFLTGIPGSMGGVVAMNGGTHLGDASQSLRRVELFLWDQLHPENPLTVFHGDQLRFAYRQCLFLPENALIWAAEWAVQASTPQDVKKNLDGILMRRKMTQPLNEPSCGSVFKNLKAAGLQAWQVIDQLGLRGYRLGGAQFSEKHSNFILNLGHAKASDVKSLIELAQTRAAQELGLSLEKEVIFLGFEESLN